MNLSLLMFKLLNLLKVEVPEAQFFCWEIPGQVDPISKIRKTLNGIVA